MNIKIKRILFIFLPIFLLGIAIFGKELLLNISHHLPECVYNKYLNIYCPGCGNTRSVRALLDGDIFLSLRYNISPIVFGTIILTFYIEKLFDLFGKKIEIIPKKGLTFGIVFTLMFIYYIVRNFFSMPL